MGKGLRTDEHTAVVAVLVGARKAKGLTQGQLAKRLKKQQSYISKIETRERTCSIVEFIRIARAMREDPIALFTRVVQW